MNIPETQECVFFLLLFCWYSLLAACNVSDIYTDINSTDATG